MTRHHGTLTKGFSAAGFYVDTLRLSSGSIAARATVSSHTFTGRLGCMTRRTWLTAPHAAASEKIIHIATLICPVLGSIGLLLWFFPFSSKDDVNQGTGRVSKLTRAQGGKRLLEAAWPGLSRWKRYLLIIISWMFCPISGFVLLGLCDWKNKRKVRCGGANFDVLLPALTL